MLLFERLRYIDHKSFRRKSAEQDYGRTALPAMVPATMAEPWAWGNCPARSSYVMSREEEAQRFLELNYAKRQFNLALLHAKGKDRQRLPYLWRDRVQHLEEYLVRVNLALVFSLLSRQRGRYSHIDWNEGVSLGQTAVFRAVGKFNVARGFKFSTYACRAILRELDRANMRAGIRQERVSSVEQPEDFMNDAQDVAQAEAAATSERVEELRYVLECNAPNLNDDERLVVTRRFGLDGRDAETLEVVGNRLNVTKERVRQIQIKALAKLRGAMEVFA
jgi:RNA polymerase primary sigma factor